MARIDLTAARREATFVALLEGYPVTGSTLHSMIGRAISRYGTSGCAGIVAAEFGDHPEVAVWRMRRARALVADSYPAHRSDGPSGSTALAAAAA